MSEEIWKDIYYYDFRTDEWVDYRGIYQISNLGNVKSLERFDTLGRIIKEKILKCGTDKDGYVQVLLYKNGKSSIYKIHRLVAFMFIKNDDMINKKCINHKDKNKQNNNVKNLEWCTHEYNINYGNRNKNAAESKFKKGNYKSENNPRCLKVAQYDLNGNLIRIWDYAKQVTEEFGWNYNTFNSHLTGKCSSKYKGFIWKYYDKK